ncbi:alpha/beta hydrolase [Candidatus Thiodiazotropha sp. CDECU1]|uniref:alpha/beta hydrolase n=1 Tax=Candidatus Thiodiazotropha sp. CDECU1 TaxID=3065865 RepID=UPI002930CAC1|nr:alpha/beta fold hydrolase [Candidatus Thiodiazotropha sp. CDECU1]
MTYSRICCIAIWALLAACTTPSERFDGMAQEQGFHRTEVEGGDFSHVIYDNGKLGTSSTLHVYLGGDGTPWIGGFIIASDPTPRRPVTLKLMAMDKSPSLFLGRPCYHGYSDRHPCTPDYWTSARYSEDVIDSMARVLRKIMAEYGHTNLHLVGFSGGGGLAMLMAEKFPETQSIVTIAGNLDVETWADLHGYDPLEGSKNPKSISPLPTTIRQYHLAGGKDSNIPPGIIRDALINQPDSRYILFEDFTHICCWEEIWQAVLACVADRCEGSHLSPR